MCVPFTQYTLYIGTVLLLASERVITGMKTFISEFRLMEIVSRPVRTFYRIVPPEVGILVLRKSVNKMQTPLPTLLSEVDAAASADPAREWPPLTAAVLRGAAHSEPVTGGACKLYAWWSTQLGTQRRCLMRRG